MNYPRSTRLAAAFFLAVSLIAAGCGESSLPNPTGEGAVRGINAIVTAPELAFLIEERPLANLGFRGVNGFTTWDDFEYFFNFDYVPPGGGDIERIASELIDVMPNQEYTVVLAGSMENPSIISWETPERDWDGSETFLEVDFAHFSPLLGQLDVYFLESGAVPELGTAVGTLDFGERIPYLEIPEGNYVIALTPPGEPETVIFQSDTIITIAQERLTISIYDPDPARPAPASVAIIFPSGAVTLLPDARVPPQVRILHATFDIGNVDGYFGENLETLVYPDVAYQQTSTYANTLEPLTPLTVTAAGDPGDIIYEADVTRIANSRRTLALIDSDLGIGVRPLADDARPLETYPIFRISHFSTNVEFVDIYEVDPGTELDESIFPRFFGVSLGITTEFVAPSAEGPREFILTLNREQDPIATSLVIDGEPGAVIDIGIFDTAVPNVVDLLIFDSNL